MSFIYFYCLITLARTSNTVLDIESEYPCLISHLRGKAFSFSPSRAVLAVGLSYTAFVVLSYFHYLSNLLMKECWSLLNIFSELFEMIMQFLYFIFKFRYPIDWFAYILVTMNHRNIFYSSWYIIFFNILLNLVC